MYLPYIEALQQKFDITGNLVDADIVMILGAWTRQGAQLARMSRKMGIPYIVCPLGDLSERNCRNPHFKRSLQTLMYQKAMYRHSDLIIATTPLEKAYLEKLGWNKHITLIRYFGYSHLITEEGTMEDWQETDASPTSSTERQKPSPSRPSMPSSPRLCRFRAECRIRTSHRSISTTCIPYYMQTIMMRMLSTRN